VWRWWWLVRLLLEADHHRKMRVAPLVDEVLEFE
jgi:hypothetical protein